MKLLGIILVIGLLSVPLCYGEDVSCAGKRETVNRLAGTYRLGPCPVCGKKAYEPISRVYEARLFYFCDHECASKFEKDPLKYLARIKDTL
ncbi:MAG: hypothetical protein P9M00_11665 [Candidatus Tritonobacter lacicola]|nr:hypothetical protein [Candidatus Tritonobacter lacicola]